jgi:hypothetical protein
MKTHANNHLQMQGDAGRRKRKVKNKFDRKRVKTKSEIGKAAQ